MTDTPPEMEAKMREMMMKKTPAERLHMGCSMFDMAKRLVVSSILQKDPHTSPKSLKKEIFLRFYGNDFDEATKKKILGSILA